VIIIDQWSGLVTNASPYGIKPGAAVTQVNLQVLSPGELTVRPGTVALSFTTHTGSTSGIWRSFRYPSPTESIIYQSRDGVVRIAQGPS
jgi:hypothetical protein